MSDDIFEIGIKGFALPLLSVLDSIMTHVLIQLFNTVGNLFVSIDTKFEISGYATYAILFTIMICLMTICGYFKDFTDGIDYQKRATIYGVCAFIGLGFFWNSVGGISQGDIGQNAIVSSIITIVLLSGGGIISWHYSK